MLYFLSQIQKVFKMMFLFCGDEPGQWLEGITEKHGEKKTTKAGMSVIDERQEIIRKPSVSAMKSRQTTATTEVSGGWVKLRPGRMTGSVDKSHAQNTQPLLKRLFCWQALLTLQHTAHVLFASGPFEGLFWLPLSQKTIVSSMSITIQRIFLEEVL